MRHTAKESRCFVVGCSQAFSKDDIPDTFSFKERYLQNVDGWINPGNSVIVDPDGKLVTGPVAEEETILYAEIKPEQLVGPRWQLDVAGHYARPDIFELRLHRRSTPFLRTMEEASPAENLDPANGEEE
jgi:nitrilase